MKFLEKLSALPPPLVFACGIVFVLLVGIADRTFGPTVTFSLFYILPIGIVSWACGLWRGVVCAVLSASLRLWADMTWWPQLSLFVHGWNTFSRLGNFVAIAIMIAYIKRRYSERLLRAEAKYARIVETAIEGVVATDDKFSIRFVNGRAAAYLGWSPETLVGMNLMQLIPDEFSRLAIHNISQNTNTNARSPFEVRFTRSDSKPLWALVSGSVQADGVAATKEIVLLLTDISDRKRAEEEMRVRYNHITSMQYLSSVLSLSFNLSERLVRTVESVLEVSGLSCGAVFLFDGGEKRLRLQHFVGFTEAQATALHQWHSALTLDAARLPLLPKFVSDLPKLSLDERNALQLDGIRTLATIPLVSKGNVLGVLDLASQTYHQFTNDEELLLQTFGRQIAIAVENAKLLDDAQQREQQVRKLSLDLARLQEDERKNFARELHDGLSQVLTTLKIMTELAVKNHRTDIEGTEQHLREVITLAEEAQAEAKQIAHGLRPAVLDDFGLKAAIPMLASRFERRTGIVVELHLPSDDVRFDTLVETNVYRIVQELLANVAKHSNANRVVVQLLERNGTLALNLSDNGVGLPKDTLLKGDAHHSGLRNLRERVEFLGGTFRAESTAGSGTEFLIEIPATVAAQQSTKVEQPT